MREDIRIGFARQHLGIVGGLTTHGGLFQESRLSFRKESRPGVATAIFQWTRYPIFHVARNPEPEKHYFR
jgi:hypothetical protein